MTLFAPAIGAYWQLLESYGLDAEAIFKEAGVNPEAMYDAGARIPAKAVETIVAQGYALAGDPLFALREAEYFRPAHLGALGFAWLASSNLRMAFERMSRYSTMINDSLSITLDEFDDHTTIRFSNEQSGLNNDLREQIQLSLAVKCCRAIASSNFNPASVILKQRPPDDTSAYFAYFRCPLEFNQDKTALVITNDQLNRKLTGSNEQLAQLNEHIVIKYLAHAQKNDIINRSKAAIIDSLSSGSVTEQQVAEKLHMTSRNLHRKLQKEETSFKVLLNEVRQELALQYIQDRSMTLTEISFMLGFSEVSSFSRAFKNWTGKPPSEARKPA